jgi:hypothetical protein
MLSWHVCQNGRAAIVGTPSASSAISHGREPCARYNLLDIDAAKKRVELVGRGIGDVHGAIVELERRELDIAE